MEVLEFEVNVAVGCQLRWKREGGPNYQPASRERAKDLTHGVRTHGLRVGSAIEPMLTVYCAVYLSRCGSEKRLGEKCTQTAGECEGGDRIREET